MTDKYPHLDPKFRPLAEAFSKTIFWNSVDEWPGPKNREPELPLEIRRVIGSEDGEEEAGTAIRFVSGEVEFCVAFFPARPNMAGPDSSNADAKFVANLPVFIPDLLQALSDANARVAELEGQLHFVGQWAQGQMPGVGTFGIISRINAALAAREGASHE